MPCKSTTMLTLALLLSGAWALGACTEDRRTGDGGGGSGPNEGEGESPGEGEGEVPIEGEGEGEGDEGEGEGGPPVRIGCENRCHCSAPLICDPDASEEGECVSAPPTCADNSGCECGRICDLGTCLDGCFNDGDCGDEKKCVEVGPGNRTCFWRCGDHQDCPDTDEVSYDCIDGACIPSVDLCAACEEDLDCGGPTDRCIEFRDLGAFCTKDCAANPNGCPDGFRCVDVNREEDGGNVEELRLCVPRVGDCTSVCSFVGCDDPDFPHCNELTGRCAAVFAACDPCRLHEECGTGNQCLEFPRDTDNFHCFHPCPNGVRDCGDAAVWRCDDRTGNPWCVPLSGTCDRCAGRPDACPLTPHCNPGDGQFVECLADIDCDDGQVCGRDTNKCISSRLACGAGEDGEARCTPEAPICYEGSCVGCVGNADCRNQCPPEQECGPQVCHRFQCMGDDFCNRVNCPEGTRCINEARRCSPSGQCDEDEDCPPCGMLCDQARRVCYKNNGGCDHNGDCPPNLVCNTELNLCEGCADNTQCRQRQLCLPNPVLGRPNVCIQS
jgi:hypothetical protein